MDYAPFRHLVDVLFRAQTVLWIIWFGMALLTVILLVLMRTRWGRSRPMRKCVVLSVFAHLLLLAYAATVEIVVQERDTDGDGITDNVDNCRNVPNFDQLDSDNDRDSTGRRRPCKKPRACARRFYRRRNRRRRICPLPRTKRRPSRSRQTPKSSNSTRRRKS